MVVQFCDIFYMGLFLYGRCLRFIALYTQKLVVVSLDNSSTKSKKWNVYRHFSFRLNFPFTYCYLSKNDLCLDSQRGLSWEYELFAFTVLEEKVDGEKKLIDSNIEFFFGSYFMLEMFSNNSLRHFDYFSDLNVVQKPNILELEEMLATKIFMNIWNMPV